MRSIEFAVEEETARALTAEADLLGFEDRETYLRWLVEHRHAIEGDDERIRRLAAVADRASDRSAPATNGDSDPTMDGEVERVARVSDEDLAVAAETLSTVESERLDEFARRAVERTRSRLGEDVASGLTYDADTSLAPENGARPGSDLTDLAEIDPPGNDEELLERRRTAVGAALALLADEGEAKRNDFVDALYEEFPAGYESEASWWRCVKTGLRQVDRVDPAGASSRVWRYRTTPGRVTRISF